MYMYIYNLCICIHPSKPSHVLGSYLRTGCCVVTFEKMNFIFSFF